MKFLGLGALRELATSSEPEGVGEVQADAVRFGAGLDLLTSYLVDGGVTIDSALDRMRATREHAKAEPVVVLLPAVLVDCDE